MDLQYFILHMKFLSQDLLIMEYSRMFKVREFLDLLTVLYGNEDDSLVKHPNLSSDKDIKNSENDSEELKRLKKFKIKDYKSGNKGTYCDICKRVILHHYHSHRKYVHGKDIAPTPCKICGKLLKRKDYLLVHMRRVHSDNNTQSVSCDICGKEMKSMERLQIHKKTVHIDLKVPCSLCDRKFKNKFYLKTHMRTSHSDDAFHVCPICGKSLKNIRLHMELVHSERKGVDCEICGKTFLTEQRLKVHARWSHTNVEKTHTCETCGDSFKSKTMLKNHYVRHSDDRNYKCNLCDKTFKLKCILQTHKRVHNIVDPYTCQKCGESFKWKGTFDRHLEKCSVT